MACLRSINSGFALPAEALHFRDPCHFAFSLKYALHVALGQRRRTRGWRQSIDSIYLAEETVRATVQAAFAPWVKQAETLAKFANADDAQVQRSAILSTDPRAYPPAPLGDGLFSSDGTLVSSRKTGAHAISTGRPVEGLRLKSTASARKSGAPAG